MIPIYLIHYNDEIQSVCINTLASFKQVIQILPQNELLIELLTKQAEIPNEFYYDSFINEIIPILIKNYGHERLRLYLDIVCLILPLNGIF